MALAYLAYGYITSNLKQIQKKGIPYGVPITISGLTGIWLTAAQ